MRNRTVKVGINDLASCFPEIADEWDYEKNDISPWEVVFGSNKKYFWICRKGHKWETSIASRTGKDKTGCPYCSNKKVLAGYNDLESNYPEMMHEWDYSKNNYLPSTVSAKSGKRAWWKCKQGHSWQAIIAQRTAKNTTCPVCSGRMADEGVNDLVTISSDLLVEWDYEKNTIDPSSLKMHSQKKVWWICKACGWSYSQTVDAKQKASMCPECAKGLRTSFPEKAIYYYVKKAFANVMENYRPDWLDGLEIDVYLPENKVAIEVDGGYFHNIRKRDVEKSRKCKELGITLIRIRDAHCEDIETEDLIIRLQKYTYAEYAKVIKEVLKTLGVEHASVDIERDRKEIDELVNYVSQDNNLTHTHPELCVQWNVVKNLPLSPEKVTYGSSRKVWWICARGHEWIASIANRARLNRGCPVCAGHVIIRGENDLLSIYPEIEKEWDYEKNSIDPSTLAPKTHIKVWWRCSLGHSYECAISEKTAGSGCPICKNRIVLSGFNDLRSREPNLVSEWDHQKNSVEPEKVLFSTLNLQSKCNSQKK